MSNIVFLNAAREIRNTENRETKDYQERIANMTKLDLLEEMIRFQEERSETGSLTLSLMVRGKILFKALEASAETREMRNLSRSYRKHLEYELSEYLKKSATPEIELEIEQESGDGQSEAP